MLAPNQRHQLDLVVGVGGIRVPLDLFPSDDGKRGSEFSAVMPRSQNILSAPLLQSYSCWRWFTSTAGRRFPPASLRSKISPLRICPTSRTNLTRPRTMSGCSCFYLRLDPYVCRGSLQSSTRCSNLRGSRCELSSFGSPCCQPIGFLLPPQYWGRFRIAEPFNSGTGIV